MTGFPTLSLITFLPVIGVLAILVLRFFAKPSDAEAVKRNSRWIALWTTLATLALSVLMVANFDTSNAGFQFNESVPWFAGASYRMGVDGISVLFVLLTAFLMPICIAASWKSIEDRVAEYMIAFLLLETLVIGVFCALDLILFYIFFEGGLIPMFLIIGIWGGKNRVYAAYKFFLYTLLGSVLMLAAILAMASIAKTTSIPELMVYKFAPGLQIWLFLAFFASFAVKMPMWPVHTWLPDAHVEAPTAGSVILAGILLKLGGYGFLRFSLPMFPNASSLFAPVIFALSVIAIIYTSLVAFRQTDIKKLIAYSSVAHMGFVTMGIFSGNIIGVQGAIFQMISHGLISGALFLCVGVVYDRMHTREISFYGGLVNRMPLVRRHLPSVHHGQRRLAGDQRFRRGNPHHDRRLWRAGSQRGGGGHLDSLVRRHRCHPVGGLRPQPLSPGHLRRDHQFQALRHHRSGLARDRPLRAPDHRRPDARHLSASGARRDAGLVRAAGGRLARGGGRIIGT